MLRRWLLPFMPTWLLCRLTEPDFWDGLERPALPAKEALRRV